MKITKSKESVGKVVLAVSLSMTFQLGVMLYDSNDELNKTKEQLGEAQTRIVQNQNDYKSLEQKFLSVESESKKLSKKQEELMSRLNKLQDDNNSLEKNNKNLKAEVESLKKKKADAKLRQSSSVASAGVKTASSAGYKNWNRMTVEATGYSLISDELGSDGTPSTATGTYPTAGRTIAVDPRVIPYGTRVYIPAFGGVFIAEDTGGAIKGNKIDIYMNHGDQARQWGRQKIEIFVEK